MKAMVVVQRGGGGELVLEEVPDPVAGEGQWRSAMEGTAVSFGDIEMRGATTIPPASRLSFRDTMSSAPWSPWAPEPPGCASASGVTAISLTGTYAEIVVAPAAINLAAAGRNRPRLGRGLPDQWRNVIQPAHHGRTFGGGANRC